MYLARSVGRNLLRLPRVLFSGVPSFNNSNAFHMPRLSVRSLILASTSLLALAAACSDYSEVGEELLEPITAGVTRDSLLKVMGSGPLTGRYADTLSLDHGFRLSQYLLNGQLYEVLYYREAAGDVKEPVRQEMETPIIIKDGKVLGWGWKYYVEEGIKGFGLPTPLKEAVPAAGPPVTPVPAAPAAADSSAGPKA